MVGWRVYEVYGVEMVPMVSQRSDDLIWFFSRKQDTKAVGKKLVEARGSTFTRLPSVIKGRDSGKKAPRGASAIFTGVIVT